MTAAELADLLRARSPGPGKWQARCPSHDDRHPSLTIRQGRDAVLVRCWSHGCTPEQIVHALGLSMRDLFDAPLTPAQRAEAAQKRQERDAESRAVHHAGVEFNRELYRLEKLRDALGGLLARRPDDTEGARMFHGVLDKLHQLESSVLHNQDGPLRCEPSPAIWQWIAEALVEIGRNFDAKETACCEQAA